VTALRALGLDTKAAADKGSSAKDGVKAADGHAVVKGTMYHLQLLLRTFAAVCRYQQQVTSVLCMAECVDAPLIFLCCLAYFTMQPLLVYHAVFVGVWRASRTLQYWPVEPSVLIQFARLARPTPPDYSSAWLLAWNFQCSLVLKLKQCCCFLSCVVLATVMRMQPLLCAQGKGAGSLGSAGLQELLLMLLALRLDPTGQLLAVEIQVTLSTLFTDKSPLRCVPALEELTQGHGSTVHWSQSLLVCSVFAPIHVLP